MSRDHAGVALEAAVTVAAASRHPHGTAQMPAAVPLTGANAGSGATTAQIISSLAARTARPGSHQPPPARDLRHPSRDSAMLG